MASKNISTQELQGLVPAELTREIIKDVAEGSVMLQMAKVKEMNAPVMQFPVELEKPGAYVVGEGQKITVDKASWKTIELQAKKIGVIVPATKEALADGIINIPEEVKASIANAFAAKIDEVTLFNSTEFYGAGKSIVELATTNSKTLASTGQIFEDASNLMGLIEEEDLDPNGFIASRVLKAKIRNDKDAANHYVVEDKVNGEPARMHGEAIVYSKNFNKEKAELITGDFDKVYVGILDEIEYKVSEEGTVGDINLFEQDMVAIRATMRVGFLVVKEDAFAVLTPAAALAAKTRSK